jgi:hypothetical protein
MSQEVVILVLMVLLWAIFFIFYSRRTLLYAFCGVLLFVFFEISFLPAQYNFATYSIIYLLLYALVYFEVVGMKE